MTNLLLPRREILTQQPRGVPRVHHPAFSRKGSYVYAPWVNPSAVFMLGGAKLPMTTRGGPTTRATSAGLAGKFVASNGDCITNQGFSQGLSPPIVTVVVASTGASTGAVRSIFGVSGYGVRYTGICASAAGNTWEYRYGGSGTAALLTSTTAFPDDDLCVIVGVSYSSSNHELYVNGNLEATSTVSGGGDPSLDSLMVGCGNGSRTWDLRANGLIAFGAIGQGILSRVSVSNLALNPWQIFAPREARLFVPVSAGGSTLDASASGAAQASGAASLAAQVALSAVGVSVAGGSAASAASIPLSAVGFSVSSGSANALAAVTISAAGLAQAAGTANLSGGAAGSISATGQAQAGGSALLNITVTLNATGSSQSSGSANLSGGAPGQVAASGGAQAGGSAQIKATVSISAAGYAQAMASGQLSIQIPLSAFGGAISAGSAHLVDAGGSLILTRAPAGQGPIALPADGYRPQQSSQSRPGNTGGRRI